MGFSSSLQGSTSHEALLVRMDAEIRLLENMRRCLALRIKADRDYTISLNAFVLQAQKMDYHGDGANMDVMTGSFVAKAWTIFIEESERAVKYVKENAEFLAGQTTEKLNHLYTEKKANRKQYQEEYNRISSELVRLQEAVQKTRTEYDRCLDSYSSSKIKFEEAAFKGKTGKRYEDAKDRYHKTCKKLHLTHNEYVMLLCEASEFERDMRTILLPGLLEHQQAIQEDMIEKWKIILQDIQRCSNVADKKFQDLYNRIESNIISVKSSEEYTKFIENHKTAPPKPLYFKFDTSLLDNHKLNLSPNAIVLNDLTMDSLKHKLAENESKLAECRCQIKDKQTLIIQYETELATVKIKSDSASVNRMFAVKKICDDLKKEVNELRCQEQKLNRQNELIQLPINDLGSNQPPPGFDVSKETLGVTEPMMGDGSSSHTSLTSLANQKGKVSGKVINILKQPFTGGKQRFGSTHSLGRQEFESNELSESQVSMELLSPPTPPTKPVVPTNNANHTNHVAQPGGSPNPPTDIDGGSRPLEEELWFHGVLPRGEVVRLLETDGDFLVRETLRNDEKQIVLSVMWTSPKHFIVQTSPEGHFRFEGPAFPTVQALIAHQYQSSTSVTSRSGAVLKTPILREKWELNNDDVELTQKIGKGNFGDVYRATLNPGRQLVAVKTCKNTLPEEQKKKFLQEGRILKQYDHPNIVKFIGICVQKQPIMIVMELVPGGSLLNFLRNQGEFLQPKHLLGMCLDTSAGMEYLESKNCIHRDLAARNCLVGDGNVVKISDFGMSREEEEYIVSDGLKQIPIKWTAPEALNYGKYTSLCDVWSFGVLCWEIFSRGGTPYQGMTNTRAREMIESGYRMPAPEGIPEEVYELMLRCWKQAPEERPHFKEIHAVIEMLHSRASVGPETRV